MRSSSSRTIRSDSLSENMCMHRMRGARTTVPVHFFVFRQHAREQLPHAFPVGTPVRYASYPWIATVTQGKQPVLKGCQRATLAHLAQALGDSS